MWPDEEDEPLGGPVPDPSERSWRHPSEVGAGVPFPVDPGNPDDGDEESDDLFDDPVIEPHVGGEAVDGSTPHDDLPVLAGVGLDPTGAPQRSLLWPLSVLSGCLAAATLGAVALYLLSTPTSVAVGGPTGPNVAMKNDAGLRGRSGDSDSSTSTSSPGFDLLGPSNDAGPVQYASDEFALEMDEVQRRTTTLPVAVPSTSAGSTTELTTAVGRPAEQQVSSMTGAVHSPGDESGQPLAAITVHNGLLLTSASAIGTHRTVVLHVGDRRIEVAVTATDPWSDLAVLVPNDPDGFRSDGALPESGEGGPGPEPGVLISVGGAPTEQPEAVTDQSTDAPPTGPTPDRMGTVLAVSEQARTGRGITVYGLIRSNIPFETGLAGAPVFDVDGRLIGMATDTVQPNVSALPIERLTRYAEAMAGGNQADTATLGFDVETSEAGDVPRIVSVDDPGPSAGVLLADDRLITLDGGSVADHDQLVAVARQAGVGATLTAEIRRNGVDTTLRLTVGG